MANLALFVTETKIKAYTAVRANVNPAELTPFIYEAQDTQIQEILGTTFYDVLQAQIVGATVTAVNRNLIDNFIVPYLLPAALYLALPNFQYGLWNKGIIGGASEPTNSVAADMKVIELLRNDLDRQMAFRRERLRKELQTNRSLYPDYTLDATQNLSPANLKSYSTSMALYPSYRTRSKTMNQDYKFDINGSENNCNDCS